MNSQIPILKKKLKALQTDGVPLVLADFFNIIKEEMFEQTGLSIKREGFPIQIQQIYGDLRALYQQQLDVLLSEEDTRNVRQIDLEESIKEIKNEI